MSATSALAGKCLRHFANTRRLLQAQSSFKILFITAFAVLFEISLAWLFLDAFGFLHRMGGIGMVIINKLFSIFFLGLGLMLLTSSIVTSYSTIYRSEEVPFLVTRPFTPAQIVVYKFIESTMLSSWAFFFIIIPFVGAYAIHTRISPVFAVWNLLFALPFLVICSAAGTLITMAFIRWCPLGRTARLAGIVLAAGAVLLLVLAVAGHRSVPTGNELNLARLLPGFTLASNPLLPSCWVAEGIMSMTGGQWVRGFLFWSLVVTTAMLALIIVEYSGNRVFYDGWQRLAGSTSNNQRTPLLLQGLYSALSALPLDIRAIIMKDIRTFLRDPVQWSQALIFFGLLALYFSNLRTFRYHTFPENWRNTIAFLNIFSVSAVICSLGSRFIYPQLSLEGQGFWILGLSPAKMSRVLLTKFAMAVTCMLTVSAGLMALSARMLSAAPAVTAVAILLACAISLAVCGLSTGLGAIFLDLTERNPAAIVSGFGGTLNLVLSLAFMLLAIVPFGVVFHMHLMHRLPSAQLFHWLLACGAWVSLLTIISVAVPLRLGLTSLLNREF